ncbi:MAG: DNA-binding domain-containing protein [Candidatus Kentron sp. G]|nr:MAG: DNA-binding domain-containing protein [Candidatus Kentron sp. G]VFM99893.1 MAG: DNA-binding domain-containing protein [Candidatus Kentron sp. G]
MARRMRDRGATVEEDEIVALLTDAIAACESLLLEGKRVSFGALCQFYPRITGIFDGPADHFDPARHQVDVGATPGQGIRKTVREGAQVAKVEATKPIPAPVRYVDLASSEIDTTLTPGNIGAIDGYRLKFDPDKAEEGVFLIDGTGVETKVTQVQKNKPGQLIFLNPPGLAVGDYELEVRAHPGRQRTANRPPGRHADGVAPRRCR